MTTKHTADESPSKLHKLRRKLPVLLFLPYLVGILWHAAHPMVSVFTGQPLPRKWYIDENSLEPSYFRMDFRYDLVPTRQRRETSSPITSLCQALKNEDNDSISCVRYGSELEVVRVLPSIAVSPTTEALVVVVPSSRDWATSQFHASVVQLIRRLSTAPWLAKTVLVVTSEDLSLSETVDTFLDTYLGTREGSWVPPSGSMLPFSGSMLRALIVLDSETTGRGGNEIRILPQGRRGVLPNMDMTFLGTSVYKKLLKGDDVMVVHPHRRWGQDLYLQMLPYLPAEWHEWGQKFIEFVLFEYTLLMGPYPPHAEALDRGIDAISIQASLQENNNSRRNTAQFVQKMENALRALSNLHERLHHSTSLYLLVSPDRFVKHEEYLVPNLLLVIPLVIRAVFLILVDIPSLDWQAVSWAVQWTVVAALACVSFLSFLAAEEKQQQQPKEEADDNDPTSLALLLLQVMFGVVYAVLLFQSRFLHQLRNAAAAQSIQFVACLWGIAVHVPLAFGHVSLAVPSALLWTPLIAFSSYNSDGDTATAASGSKKKALVVKALGLLVWFGVLIATCPCNFLVPNVFPTYTVYVQYGYLPLHILVTLLQLSRIWS